MKRAILWLPVFFAMNLMAGELMVHPTRVVLEGTARTAQIDLINSGTEPMTYRVSVVNRRMTETGDFAPVDRPAAGEQFADEMIRVSPRQVVLQPGVAQAVRLQLRKPAELPDGEYRTHLIFKALPPTESTTAAQAVADPESLDIQLTAIYSVSIPVIVRHGATSASVTMGDVEVRRTPSGTPAVAVTIGRSGTRSVYGDLTVSLGNGRVVGRANGIAVYTPNATRRVLLPLPALPGGVPRGELRVAFAERPEQRGKASAEATLTVR